MKRVRQSGTTPEQIVRRALSRLGARYRVNVPDLPGRPDIAHKGKKKAVFVNGCFWHWHEDCRRGTIPKTNPEFWREKLQANRDRDRRKIHDLEREGFDVLTVWECEMIDGGGLEDRLRRFWYGA